MSVTSKALWYIESHLDGELSLRSIAESIGVSPFHLSRAFPVSTGCSLACYMRARRLSEAARALAQGAPDILSLALDAGYGSHEAFTRAFRQQFGVTPEQFRANPRLDIRLQEPIRMDQATTSALASPRTIASEAHLILGLGQRYQCEAKAGIPSQWNSFLPHLGHIQGQIGKIAYGVICNSDESGNFDYICGVEVRRVPLTTTRIHALANSAANVRGVRTSRPYFGHREHLESDLGARTGRRGTPSHGRTGARSLRRALRQPHGLRRPGTLGPRRLLSSWVVSEVRSRPESQHLKL